MKMQIFQRTKRWTDEERQYIKDNYLILSDKEIGEKLERSTNGIKEERLKLGLIRPRVSHSTKKKKTKLTFAEVEELFKAKGYILLSGENEYINQSSKMRYICPKHKDKGEQTISVYHIKEGKGCYYCGRERTATSRKSKVTEEEDRALCDLKGFDYVKTKIEDGIPYIYFICRKHKMLGIQKMRRGNMNREQVNGCQYCINRNLPHWYVKYIIESNYDIDVISEYQGMNKNLTCKCRVHNRVFTTLAKYVYHDGVGCQDCGHDKLVLSQRLPLEEVERRIIAKNPNLEILNLNQYTGWESRMNLRCKKCGATWESPFYSIINNTGRCPVCERGSHGEQKISQLLMENNIEFIPQYQFDDCRGKSKPLPFDFGLLDNNENILGLIEYNGEQHYRPIEYFGGEKKFKQQIERDQIKKNYCEVNNIPLLIIPYWDFENISKLVNDFIETL